MEALYFSLPPWLSTLIVAAACVLVCVGAHLAVRAMIPKTIPRQDTELAVALMGVIAVFIGIMLAFSAVQVWQDYSDAEKAVADEAAATSQLYRDMVVYGAQGLPARMAVTAYVHSVVEDEWPAMAKGEASPKTAEDLIRVFNAVASIDPQGARQAVIYGEAFKKLNEVVEHRRARLSAAQDSLPALFWTVVLFGSAVIVGYTFVYPATPMNLLLISGLAVSLGLLFAFILDADRPFAGSVSVGPDEMKGLLPIFEMLARPGT
ncbi:MAG: hypothetical protein JWQ97_3988 [Phenylobacterium sp.]|nr:hypothetical protein [Phenylobacterium sp.]